MVSLQEASATVTTAPPEPLPAARGMPLATVAGLLAVTFIWGINFAVVKVGLAFLPPISFVALRFLAVGLILLPWMRLPRQRLGDLLLLSLVLGVGRESGDAAIKAAYRKLVREKHPDRLIAKGVPKEFVDVATEKLAAINAAYDKIAKERSLR